MNEFIATTETWWIVNDGTNIHYGKLDIGQHVTTTSEIDDYSSEQEWLTVLSGLGITPIIDNNDLPQMLMPEPFVPEILNEEPQVGE